MHLSFAYYQWYSLTKSCHSILIKASNLYDLENTVLFMHAQYCRTKWLFFRLCSRKFVSMLFVVQSDLCRAGWLEYVPCLLMQKDYEAAVWIRAYRCPYLCEAIASFRCFYEYGVWGTLPFFMPSIIGLDEIHWDGQQLLHSVSLWID
jgi:hypothetical protein